MVEFCSLDRFMIFINGMVQSEASFFFTGLDYFNIWNFNFIPGVHHGGSLASYNITPFVYRNYVELLNMLTPCLVSSVHRY